jgi:ribosome biogenesis GTPase A
MWYCSKIGPTCPVLHELLSCCVAFYQVIELADVVIEVLDARDPLGSRCPQVEEAVISHGPNKKLILLLNKIGMLKTCY